MLVGVLVLVGVEVTIGLPGVAVGPPVITGPALLLPLHPAIKTIGSNAIVIKPINFFTFDSPLNF